MFLLIATLLIISSKAITLVDSNTICQKQNCSSMKYIKFKQSGIFPMTFLTSNPRAFEIFKNVLPLPMGFSPTPFFSYQKIFPLSLFHYNLNKFQIDNERFITTPLLPSQYFVLNSLYDLGDSLQTIFITSFATDHDINGTTIFIYVGDDSTLVSVFNTYSSNNTYIIKELISDVKWNGKIEQFISLGKMSNCAFDAIGEFEIGHDVYEQIEINEKSANLSVCDKTMSTKKFSRVTKSFYSQISLFTKTVVGSSGISSIDRIVTNLNIGNCKKFFGSPFYSSQFYSFNKVKLHEVTSNQHVQLISQHRFRHSLLLSNGTSIILFGKSQIETIPIRVYSNELCFTEIVGTIGISEPYAQICLEIKKNEQELSIFDIELELYVHNDVVSLKNPTIKKGVMTCEQIKGELICQQSRFEAIIGIRYRNDIAFLIENSNKFQHLAVYYGMKEKVNSLHEGYTNNLPEYVNIFKTIGKYNESKVLDKWLKSKTQKKPQHFVEIIDFVYENIRGNLDLIN
ncbi:hypothetical protein QTN25_007602 [Entamoeba marina]